MRLSIPIRPHVAAEMNLPRPMTSADWDQMMAVLETMKPGIVKDDECPGITREDEDGG